MFILSKERNRCVNLAHRDVLAFLQHHSANDSDYSFLWKKAREQIRNLDSECKVARVSRISGFVGPFLEWLEQRKGPPPLPPWVRQDHKTVLDHKSFCGKFLRSLHSFLNGLSHPAGKNHNGKQIGNQLRRFGTFIATQKLASTLLFYPKPITLKLHGFASWLIVGKSADKLIIYAVYDQELVRTSATHIVVRRLEKIFLHEFGHARIHLDYYLKASAQKGVIRSRPVDETRAWLYALAVRSYISSARSRISRLIGEYDNEWKY